ncbi:DUF58 domain-containing protein [Noviherbaspirillum cavernae]|uniref:DUF58 domain-containing protein n=1 Tax=Noviherbaspirillum cavernae TaxID=2320862 RepID=A0A418WYF9_9BURK|nr:DUF58 domain-containing protein [Noviherbaspirillum cavernae]RJG05257.1 DUF58 domain-containing protein [Noviherbaspirillum cavernae]
MLSALEHQFRKRASKWLMRSREVEPGEVFLHQRRVYIMPTHPGLMFCVMLFVLFIGAINYNISLGFGFTFLLAACALIDMHLTFRNLAHLSLSAGRAAPVFAGEDAQFELHLINRRKHGRYAIWLDFVGEGLPNVDQAADVAALSTHSVVLSTPARQRGWLAAPRVRLQTRFPLGLLRAWSYWQPDARVLVYPQPEENAPPLPLSEAEKKDGQGQAGQDDFAGIRNYQAGDSLKRLAWRQIAKLDVDLGGALVTKYFEGGAAVEFALDFDRLPNRLDQELKLSRMTRWVIEAEARGVPYAFRLGDTVLTAALGPAHREACLHALAMYPET